MLKLLKKFDLWCEKYRQLAYILLLVVILRIPNLFEPYWYGDEGIYLTLGQAMNRGIKLYSEIIDHKTPIIYYLARVHTQLNFRVLTIAWMLVTTSLFYLFSRNFFELSEKKINHKLRQKLTFLATMIFALLTTLPALEGNIPNGELFVLGFVMAGGYLITKSTYFKDMMDHVGQNDFQSQVSNFTARESSGLLLAGTMFSLAILTKVPAIFDLGTFLSVGYLSLANSAGLEKIRRIKFKHLLQNLSQVISREIMLVLGVLGPIIVSAIYYVAVGSGKDYLDIALLYNFRYAGEWQLPFTNPMVLFFFSLTGKVSLLFALALLLFLLKKRLRVSHQFLVIWLGMSVIGATLSNRPYPHYLIQVVPPLALILAVTIQSCVLALKNKSVNSGQKIRWWLTIFLIMITMLALRNSTPVKIFTTGFRYSAEYYLRWIKLSTGRISAIEYRNSFNYLMNDNYKAAKIIRESGTDRIFIWGTNPMLYALSQTSPAGRFTVAFHIKDFDAYQETLGSVKTVEPNFIVVMNDEVNSFPTLNDYITKNYIRDDHLFDNFTLWRKIVKTD